MSYPRLPNNTVAITLMLVSLILCGGGLLNWNKDRMFWAQYWELQRSGHSPISILKTPKDEIIRQREKIELHQQTPTPVVTAQADRTPIISRIPTAERVVFITIDDGITKGEEVAHYLADRKLPVTAFLTIDAINNNFGYFGELMKHGTTIQNHTVSHPNLTKHPPDFQTSEICSTSVILENKYGARPKLFRPPYGEYNDNTLQAAAACGIKATVMWSVVMNHGALSYQGEPGLKPGDIILLHYKPELKSDLEATVRAIGEQGFKIGHLEDWIL